MSQLKVKICGTRMPETAVTAREAGADLLGLIFAPSTRTVTPAEAAAVARAARATPNRAPLVVGIFVNETVEAMRAVSDEVGLDLIQLSGDEPPEILPQLNRPVIKALRLPQGTTLDEAAREADQYLTGVAPAWAILLDSHVPGSYGGTGTVGDWELAAQLAERFPVILAGGLTPENVADAVRAVRPFAVDSSSGVETDRIKDSDKIRRFIASATAADAALETVSRSYETPYFDLARTT